jgi:glycine C-acetyltransferase
MDPRFHEFLAGELRQIREQGLWKEEWPILGHQGPEIQVQGRERPVLNFCANNYLGLSGHPDLLAAAHRTLEEWGYGMSSVRFICGTQALHLELEKRVAAFLGMEDAILYAACFDANGGVFEPLLGADDAILTDRLNHASIIDGVRLCKARRLVYEHADMRDLEAKLGEAAASRFRMIVTDGVFSMDGDVAPLREIAALAEKHRALVLVDDSHATGFMGKTGRGTPEHCGARVDILTTTFGKALGGASGGCIAGSRDVIDLLRQRSRPYLFSNTLAPVVAGAGAALADDRAARSAGGEHAHLPRTDDRGRVRDPARRASHRPDTVLAVHARRRAAGPAICSCPARRRYLRQGLLLPGGAPRPVADPGADLGRARAGAHRPRGRGLHEGREAARGAGGVGPDNPFRKEIASGVTGDPWPAAR